jgi:transposase
VVGIDVIPGGSDTNPGVAMWTPTTRKQHIRNTNRYQTDMTDEEWRVIEPHLPAAKGTGRPRAWPMREIINGIFYVMRAGCPWRLLPGDLPPWSTIYRWFATFRDEGRFEKINHAMVMLDRERVGRQASPTGAIIDSQSIKTTEAGGPRGYDAGKKINGRKRHALVDTDGRGLVLEPHPANIQDRDGGEPLLRASRRIFPFIQRVFADSGYAGEKVAKATLIAVEIVRKNPDQVGFAVQPRRWVVERFFAWIGRNRRLAKDFEATIHSARAFLYAASVMLLVRRIARAS